MHGSSPLLATFDTDELMSENAVLDDIFPIATSFLHHIGRIGCDPNCFPRLLLFAVALAIFAANLCLLVLILLGNEDWEGLERGDADLMWNSI